MQMNIMNVYDIYGRLVAEKSGLISSDQAIVGLDPAESGRLPSGLYVLSGTVAGEVISTKFCVLPSE